MNAARRMRFPELRAHPREISLASPPRRLY